uniref:Major facilitator superfamily (MFS) profile domain-containing protein n=1 Tax=Clastoptera arizonana TaxID=38151 RepID=A0A1B6E0I4_9HEMI
MTEEKHVEAASMLGRAKKKEGKKLPQYLATIAVTISSIAFGSELAWTSPALPYLSSANSTLPISPEEGSWIGSLLAIGAIVGALPAGYISDIYGRKLVCAALSVPFILSWVLVCFAKSVYFIYIARLLAGFATGASSAICPMYIGEIAEASIRGTLGGYVQLMVTIGILYVYLLGAVLPYYLLNLGCGLVPIIFLIAFLNAPETPVFLLSKNRKSDAEKALRQLRGNEYDIQYELNAIENEISKSNANKASFVQIFSQRATVKALVCALGLMLFQQFSGINAVIFYSQQIFKEAGSTLDPGLSAIIVGVVQVLVTYIASLLADRAGRRVLLLISQSVMAICLGVLGYFFKMKDSGEDVSSLGLVPLASVVVFIVVFSLGAGPIPWLMVGELFTSEIKGIATGIAVGMNWTSVFIVTKTFQALINNFGNNVTFWCFGLICAVGAVFIFFIIPETKGKSLEEIQMELSGKKRSNVV